MPTSAQNRPPTAGEALPVRYYPRRIRGGRVREPLSPSQALHLADDPRRAALAARTAERRELVVRPPATRGRVRALIARVLRR